MQCSHRSHTAKIILISDANSNLLGAFHFKIVLIIASVVPVSWELIRETDRQVDRQVDRQTGQQTDRWMKLQISSASLSHGWWRTIKKL